MYFLLADIEKSKGNSSASLKMIQRANELDLANMSTRDFLKNIE